MPPKKPVAKAGSKPAAKKPAASKAPAVKKATSSGAGAAAAAAPPAKKPEKVGIEINIKQLLAVLNDEDGKMKATGKYPLVIDKSGRAATFLKYQYANYMQAVNPADMQAESLRKALIGAIRYGKPLTIDMVESDMYENLGTQLNEVQQGLLDTIISKEILKEEKYMSLVKDSDGDEYTKDYLYSNTDSFQFIIVTEKEDQKEELLEKFYTVRIPEQ
ncbi:IQ motif and ankyrin repeat domain-containing protein 1-like [Glandiceps talaboti]